MSQFLLTRKGLLRAVMMAPGLVLAEQILVSLRNRHRLSLMAALPDTTDVLSIVLGAGLSLDQAIAHITTVKEEVVAAPEAVAAEATAQWVPSECDPFQRYLHQLQ